MTVKPAARKENSTEKKRNYHVQRREKEGRGGFS